MNPVLLSKAGKIFKTGKTIQKALSDHQRGNPHVYLPKLIFFDMDGVLTVKPHTTQLAEMIGKQRALSKISEKMLSKPDRGFEWLIKEMVTLFAGVPESLLMDAGKRLPIMKGAPETIKTLKKGGYTPILITNGIEQVAGVVAQRLGITKWYGNTIEIKDKTVTGNFCSSPLVTLCSKGDVVRDMVQRSSKKSAAVGNDVNDWPMFEEVDISILFNPSPSLKRHLQWCVERGEKGFKKDCIAYSRCVDIIIKERDLRLLLPFLLPHLIEKGEKNVLFAANYSIKR